MANAKNAHEPLQSLHLRQCAVVSDLSGGLVETLPAGIFDPLTSVTWLRLKDFYQLQELPANTFAQMSSLGKLTLEDVSVGSIHPDAFSGLGGLTELYALLRVCDAVNPRLCALTCHFAADVRTHSDVDFTWSNNQFKDDRLLDCNLALPDGVFAPLTGMTTL